MPPAFIERTRARFTPEAVPALPEAPSATNEMQEALEKWHSLRAYAQTVLDIARQTSEANRNLIAENSALHRQIEQLMEEISEVRRENRIAQAYAQNMRGRAGAVVEVVESMHREALQFASHSIHEAEEATPAEKAETAEVHDSIVRISQDRPTASRTVLPENLFPSPR